MKSSLLVILILSIFIISCSTDDYTNKFSFSPEKPLSGEEVTIKYKSESESINNSDEITMLVYSYSKDLDETMKVKMEKKGAGWTAKYLPSDSTKGLIAKFLSENGNDDNNELGYVIKFNDEDGNEIKGASAGLANVYSKYAGAIDLIAAKDSASKYFDLEFSKHPDLKKEYLSTYILSFPRSKRYDAAIDALEDLEKQENLAQKDLETLSNGFKVIKDYKKAEKYYNILRKDYPKSNLVSAKYYTRFRNMVRIDRMLEVFNEFNPINPENNLNNYMVSGIVRKYVSENNFSDAQKMLEDYSQYTNSNIYNSLAWNLFENNGDLEKASKFCETGIDLARKEYESPSGKKPVYLDENDWKDSKKYSLAAILDTYGNIQNKLNKKSEALTLFEEAVDLTGKEQADINENYASVLFDLGENGKAKVLIEELISEGKATDKMKKILGDIFTNDGGSEDKFDEYIGKFEGEAKGKLIEKLKEEMKNEPAPEFELTDMEGKKVKLSDYKGKTVIVDFWATWCGPCLQSFPVMKKAVEKYQDDPTVEFLFVNTWERVDDKKANAEDFLKRTKYPFHVALDDQNQVVEKFKVQGIPTKFIIDGNSNIRFQSVGFSGVESEVLEELDQMIALSK